MQQSVSCENENKKLHGIRRMGKYILLLLLLLCLGYMFSVYTTIRTHGTPVIYYLDKTPLSFHDVASMREDDEEIATDASANFSYTAVGTMENQTFSNEILNRSTTGTLLYINGTSANLVSATGELMPDDTDGCVLSSKAAWELFGETDVMGGEILCGDVSYEVRGVFENTDSIVILPAETYLKSLMTYNTGADSENVLAESVFYKMVLMPDEALSDAERSEAIDVFATANGLGEERTDCLIYWRISAVFIMLVPILVLFCLIGKGITGLVKNRRKPFRLLLLCGILIAVMVLFCQIFSVSFSIPADLIPNTWSDFDFWKEKLAEFGAGISHLLFQDKSETELSFYQSLTYLAALTGIGVILFVITNLSFRVYPADSVHERKNCHTARFLFGLMFGTCITELIAVFLLNRWGVIMDEKRMLIYLWPFFLTGKFVLMSAADTSGILPEDTGLPHAITRSSG